MGSGVVLNSKIFLSNHMYHVDCKTKMCSKEKAKVLQPVLFQLLLLSRVAREQGWCPQGEGGWPGSSPQHSPAEQWLPEPGAVTAALADLPSAQTG